MSNVLGVFKLPLELHEITVCELYFNVYKCFLQKRQIPYLNPQPRRYKNCFSTSRAF